MNVIRNTIPIAAVLLLAVCAFPSMAQGAAERDHPLISRMDGLKAHAVKGKNYDEYVFPLERQVWGKPKMKLQRVEGKVTRVTYTGDENISSFGIYRYYENELKNAGYTVLFTARGAALGDQAPHDWYDIYYPDHPLFYGQFIDNVKEQFYINAKLPRPEGDVYVTLYTIPLSEKKVMAQLDVIETVTPSPRPGAAPDVTEDWSAAMAELRRSGHYPVYGVEFEEGKAAIREGSEKTLKMIADLLESNPDIRLFIVGNTDNLQSFAQSMKISKARAAAVARALTATYKVDSRRVRSEGVGPLWPVAANSQGPASKNNRIELVIQ